MRWPTQSKACSTCHESTIGPRAADATIRLAAGVSQARAACAPKITKISAGAPMHRKSNLGFACCQVFMGTAALSYVRKDFKPLWNIAVARSSGRDVSNLEEHGIPVGAGTGIRTAVREVELCRVSAALPVSLKRLHGHAAGAAG